MIAVVLTATFALVAVTRAHAEIPPPPGGPILVVTNPADPFTRYSIEILRTEGFAAFDTVALADLTPEILATHDVTLLGAMAVDDPQTAMLSDWVSSGGALIAMRPDPRLGELCGLHRLGGTVAERYVQVVTNGGPGSGIEGSPMQFHGGADVWTLDGATLVASLQFWPGALTPWVAVSERQVGAHGGVAIAFAYDLARSVIETRQGNPAWAGEERDGLPPRRSDDLFVGASDTDPEPDWVDRGRVPIPQADMQQRLLANLIETAALHREPLPRFWYFPAGARAVVMMTGDDHAHGGTVGRFDLERAVSPAGCSAPDWECVRSSSYVYPGTPISDAEADSATADGFEIALHLNTLCQDFPTAAWLDSTLGAQLGALAGQLPALPAPSTNRTHCVTWSDWVSEARVEAVHGIRLDCTYYYWPNSFVANQPGYFTGSGIPMRFADLDGSTVDVFQAPTQIPDESQMDVPLHIGTLLDAALGPQAYYGAVVANMHTDSVVHNGWASIVAAAQLRHVPVVSGRQLLVWLDARERSTWRNLAWSGDSLQFDVIADPAARHLTVLLPAQAAAGPLVSLAVDGTPVGFATTVVNGISYARFECVGGHVIASYQRDIWPPVISGVLAIPDDEGNAIVRWDTDEPSDSRVDYGLDPSVLDHTVTSSARVLHHSLRLAGLAADTTIAYRVLSMDASGNVASWPALTVETATFSTSAISCAHDGSAADFGGGTATSGSWSAGRTGEVTLRPAFVEEFESPGLPAGWLASDPSATGITVAPAGLLLDGAGVVAPHVLEPGDAIESEARLSGPGSRLAIVTAGDTLVAAFVVLGDGTLAAVTHGDGGEDTTRFGAADTLVHRYRIERDSSVVGFALDGVAIATHFRAIDGELRFAALDSAADQVDLVIARVIATPYSGLGSFISRVFDAGAPTPWSAALWDADLPPGTTLDLWVRGGDTPDPGDSWSAFQRLTGPGAMSGVTTRYVQYRADLASVDPHHTPDLETVVLRCAPSVAGVKVTPRVTGLSEAAPNPSRGVAMMRLDLATGGAVEVAVFAIDGRRVRTLASGWRPAGSVTLAWDGRDDRGREASSGVYLVRLAAGAVRQTRRVVRVR
jgi:FlgD Ig-like domain